jgi:hypothetical protein
MHWHPSRQAACGPKQHPANQPPWPPPPPGRGPWPVLLDRGHALNPSFATNPLPVPAARKSSQRRNLDLEGSAEVGSRWSVSHWSYPGLGSHQRLPMSDEPQVAGPSAQTFGLAGPGRPIRSLVAENRRSRRAVCNGLPTMRWLLRTGLAPTVEVQARGAPVPGSSSSAVPPACLHSGPGRSRADNHGQCESGLDLRRSLPSQVTVPPDLAWGAGSSVQLRGVPTSDNFLQSNGAGPVGPAPFVTTAVTSWCCRCRS